MSASLLSASISSQDKKHLLMLGRQLANSGVLYEGEEVHLGLLKAIQHNAFQADNKTTSTAMNMQERRDYMKFMGAKLQQTSDIIAEDKENPHAQMIAAGANKTAEFLREMQKTQDMREMQQKIQEEIVRQQLLSQHHKRQQEKGIEKVLGQMIEVHSMAFGEVARVVAGLEKCKGGVGTSSKDTPAMARQQAQEGKGENWGRSLSPQQGA